MIKFTFKHRGDWKAVIEFLNDTAINFTVDNEMEVIIIDGNKWGNMLMNAFEGADIPYVMEV